MVTRYKRKNAKCELNEVLITYIQALRAPDGKGMIFSSCGSKPVAAKTVNVSGGGPGGGGRGGSGRRSKSGRRSSRRCCCAHLLTSLSGNMRVKIVEGTLDLAFSTCGTIAHFRKDARVRKPPHPGRTFISSIERGPKEQAGVKGQVILRLPVGGAAFRISPIWTAILAGDQTTIPSTAWKWWFPALRHNLQGGQAAFFLPRSMSEM